MDSKCNILLSLNAPAYETGASVMVSFFTNNSIHSHAAKRKVKHQVVLVSRCGSGNDMQDVFAYCEPSYVDVGFHLHSETLWTLAAKLQGAIAKQKSVYLLQGNKEASLVIPWIVSQL